jgi:methyl-accepting chemotaxis protein
MRAGDLGKGFSVVASEVKSLATQTANATRTITDKVYDIQSISSTAVTAINDIQATINKINDIASLISAAVEEQGASTQEIARNCNEVAAGSKVITENINALQGVAGESNAASEGVLSAVSTLEEQTNRMKLNIDAFVKGLRAA